MLREYGGKDRVFAIPSAWNQFALYPLHRWGLHFLALLPSDYTMDQLKFRRLFYEGKLKGLPMYSYDLKSATDLFPISLQVDMLEYLFDRKFAKLWKSTIRAGLWSWTLGEGSKSVNVRYTNQPMGAYSSWVVFALSHHLTVWCAGYRIGYSFEKTITLYGICGDDIIIMDQLLAESYKALLEEVKIEISWHKSIVPEDSEFHTCSFGGEFLARLYWKDLEFSRLPVMLLLTKCDPLFWAEYLMRVIRYDTAISGAKSEEIDRLTTSLLRTFGVARDRKSVV